MLVLSRREGETFMIGDNIRITVLGVKGKTIRIGVAAPKEIEVHREEVFFRLKKERASIQNC